MNCSSIARLQSRIALSKLASVTSGDNRRPPRWTFPQIETIDGLLTRHRDSGQVRQNNPTGKSLLIFRNRVKPGNQKYSA
jgi:hypothetical protein